MKTSWFLPLLFGALVIAPTLSQARKAPSGSVTTNPAPPPAEEKKAQEAPPGWRSHCESGSRNEQLSCAVEESAVLTRTGQIVVGFSIRLPRDTKTPVALIQIPVGVFLPSGIQLQIDEQTKLDLPLQTCEQRGCFAGTALTPQFLAAMRTSKELKVSFDNLTKQKLTVSLPLKGFAQAFDKIQ